MKIDKNHPCYHKSRFGDYLDHDFRYKNKELRVCVVCKEEQIYFGLTGNIEDWRPKL